MGDQLATWNSYIKCRVICSEKEKKNEDDLNHPFVTISRETGAGGVTVAQKLVYFLRAKDLDAICPWIMVDKNMVNLVLQEHELPTDFQKYMPEKKISEIRDMIEELAGLHPAQWVLVHKISETILHLAHMGYVVLVGRGSNVITRKLKGGVHVRLVGSREKRIKHCEEYYAMDYKEAKKLVEDDDKNRKGYVKQHFDKSIDDTLLYDLVINTDHVGYDQAAQIIGETVLNARKEHLLSR